jgi:hypothetical protein
VNVVALLSLYCLVRYSVCLANPLVTVLPAHGNFALSIEIWLSARSHFKTIALLPIFLSGYLSFLRETTVDASSPQTTRSHLAISICSKALCKPPHVIEHTQAAKPKSKAKPSLFTEEQAQQLRSQLEVRACVLSILWGLYEFVIMRAALERTNYKLHHVLFPFCSDTRSFWSRISYLLPVCVAMRKRAR